MTTVLSWFGLDWAVLLSTVLGFIGEQVRTWLSERRAEQALEDLGRTEAERDGAEAIGSIAEKQTARASNPPTEDELMERLKRGLG